MKKIKLLCSILLGLTILSCSSDDDENLNCTFETIDIHSEFGLTEEQMISNYSITSPIQYFTGSYFYDVPGLTEIEEERTYFTRNVMSNNDDSLERLFYSFQIRFKPSTWLCVREWVFNNYGQPDFDTVRPDVQLVYYQWYIGEPDINGEYQDAIRLTFAQADNEDFTAHLEDKVLYFTLSFVENSVFN
ncbi:hypothetical protein ACKGJY_15405 [Hyunsoonleella sp. 2307UL5-6]|uniref:hypothetical protein n=1 Tax=Hyunsoonleella sp. 2307UL5-6 TaxID=3384768 RepID=UPI0039BD53FF